jgi:hypothetical protein
VKMLSGQWQARRNFLRKGSKMQNDGSRCHKEVGHSESVHLGALYAFLPLSNPFRGAWKLNATEEVDI